MRVRDGYRPKLKFSVTLSPDIFERLDEYCKSEGIHRTTFIEESVRRMLEDKIGVRSKPLKQQQKKKEDPVGVPLIRRARRKL